MGFSTESVKNQTFVIKVGNSRATVELATEFKNELVSQVESGNIKVVVDLSGVEFIDSAFLGALVTGLKRAAAKGGEIKLAGLRQPVMALFELTRLTKVFRIYKTRKAALKNF